MHHSLLQVYYSTGTHTLTHERATEVEVVCRAHGVHGCHGVDNLLQNDVPYHKVRGLVLLQPLGQRLA